MFPVVTRLKEPRSDVYRRSGDQGGVQGTMEQIDIDPIMACRLAQRDPPARQRHEGIGFGERRLARSVAIPISICHRGISL